MFIIKSVYNSTRALGHLINSKQRKEFELYDALFLRGSIVELVAYRLNVIREYLNPDGLFVISISCSVDEIHTELGFEDSVDPFDSPPFPEKVFIPNTDRFH
jgi:hypothetical protein